MMNDEDMKIYVPGTGKKKSAPDDHEEMKVYTSGASFSSEASPEHTEHLP